MAVLSIKQDDKWRIVFSERRGQSSHQEREILIHNKCQIIFVKRLNRNLLKRFGEVDTLPRSSPAARSVLGTAWLDGRHSVVEKQSPSRFVIRYLLYSFFLSLFLRLFSIWKNKFHLEWRIHRHLKRPFHLFLLVICRHLGCREWRIVNCWGSWCVSTVGYFVRYAHE